MGNKREPGTPGPVSLSVLIGGRSTSKYDEAEFLVGGRGVGGAGETEKQSFKLFEGYIAECDRLLKSGLYPYKTLSDLYRHAAVRHVFWLQSLEPEEIEGSVLYQVSQIDDIVAAEEFQIRFCRSIESASKMVRAVIKMPGGKAHAGRVLRRIRDKIDKMRSGFWRSYYEKLFLDEFGLYLNDGLVLLSIEGEEDDCLYSRDHIFRGRVGLSSVETIAEGGTRHVLRAGGHARLLRALLFGQLPAAARRRRRATMREPNGVLEPGDQACGCDQIDAEEAERL
jgi:hypothetical protein